MHERFQRAVGPWAGLAAILVLAACAAPARTTGSGATTNETTNDRTQDERVRSFRGEAPPDVFTDGTWVSRAGPTSLSALQGRVTFVMFAFPR